MVFFFRTKERRIDPKISPKMIPNDHPIGNLPPKSSFKKDILRPTKISTSPKPYLRNLKRCMMPARRKYNDRIPRIAKILDVNTMKGSLVIAKMAGIESMANMMSVNSMKMRANRRGVP